MNGVDMMTTSLSPLSLTPISHPYLSPLSLRRVSVLLYATC
jgi:hypothetical protein